MSYIEHIEKGVSLRVEEREREESQFTEECLKTTCVFRATFQVRKGREHRFSDCSKDCPYHPDHNSPGRIRRR